MAKQEYHISASGARAGYYVQCNAKYRCPLTYSDGSEAISTTDGTVAYEHNRKMDLRFGEKQLALGAAFRAAKFGQRITDNGETVALSTGAEKKALWDELNERNANLAQERMRIAGIPLPNQNSIEEEDETIEGVEIQRDREELLAITQDPTIRDTLISQWMTEDAQKLIEKDQEAPILNSEQIHNRQKTISTSDNKEQARKTYRKKYGFGDADYTRDIITSNDNYVRLNNPSELALHPQKDYIIAAARDGWEVYRVGREVKLLRYTKTNKGMCVLTITEDEPLIETEFVRTRVGARVSPETAKFTQRTELTSKGAYSRGAVLRTLNMDQVTGQPTNLTNMVITNNGALTSPQNVHHTLDT